jgi:hypothetical protein
VQFVDLARHDDPAAAAEDLDVLAATRFQQVDHVLEEFDVPSLVGGDGNSLHILLQCRVHDLLHGTVVAEMDDLGTGRLQNAAHDVDRCVVPVKQGSSGDKAHLVLGLVGQKLLGNGKVGHVVRAPQRSGIVLDTGNCTGTHMVGS